MEVQELNSMLDETVFGSFLSGRGRRLHFPLGIIAQAQEASARGCSVNATAGVALSGGHYMTHPLFREVAEDSDTLVAYAPTTGLMQLRKQWSSHIDRENPNFGRHGHSLPVVTAGLTHSLSVMASLFVTEGQKVFTITPFWDNYDLMFASSYGAELLQLPLFDSEWRFNISSWRERLVSVEQENLLLLFNFPNNPSGYTPSDEEMKSIRDLLVDLAHEGKKILVVTDDAYFGLFHHESCAVSSLADYLADAHESIGVVKCDAATKESLVWGFRIGFITFSGKGLTERHYEALLEKVKGAVRTSVSSCSMVSQSLLLNAMKDPEYQKTLDEVKALMKSRHERLRLAHTGRDPQRGIRPIPSNSGYFSSFWIEKDAYALRSYLLEKDIAVVALDAHLIRVAYSALDESQLDLVIDALYEGVRLL